MVSYAQLRKEQEEKRRKGELMGIGISSFTEAVGAGPAHTFDIAGIKMFDSAEIRIHPTGKAICRMGTKSQGQGHETTYAQIVAEELGIPAADVTVEEGDTDTAPYGLGTYASRSTPVSGAATAVAARKIRDKAKKIAAHLLECAEEDLEWEPGKFFVKGAPFTKNFPFCHSRSASLHSRRWAAIFLALSRILRAAIAVAAPDVGVLRLA